MRIEAVTVYRVDGVDFASLAKARDFLEGEVNKVLSKALRSRGYTMVDSIRITEEVLAHRKKLVELLLAIDTGEERDE